MRAMFLVSFLAALVTAMAAAEAACPPPAVRGAAGVNLSGEREMDLGDAIAEHVERDYRLVGDPALNARLQALGEHLAAHLPEAPVTPRFTLVDLPYANAFAIAGGRVYVTRKLVAFVDSEAELAAVLAHELGHVVTRDSAALMSKRFDRVLGLTSFESRDEVFAAYHRLMESRGKNPDTFRRKRGEEHAKQVNADQLAVHALAAAGWDPEVFARFFDRFAGLEGKAGNWLTDLLDYTRPGGKRLREVLAELESGPCRAPAVTFTAAQSFDDWRAAVIAWTPPLAVTASELALEPPLRLDLDHVRFSPDGRWALAQDAANIFVIDRASFAFAFQLDALYARPAKFSPSSTAVNFHTASLRVESWDLASRSRRFVKEVVVRGGCVQSELAPDARTLACYHGDGRLSLRDVGNDAVLAEKKRFLHTSRWSSTPGWGAPLVRKSKRRPRWLAMHFSPSGRQFAAGAYSETFAWDLDAGRRINVRVGVKRLLGREFAFLGEDRGVGSYWGDYDKSGVVGWPNGRETERLPLDGQRLTASHCGQYLMMRPVKTHPVGILSLAEKDFVTASRTPAIDILGDTILGVRGSGELALYRADAPKSPPLATLTLPTSQLAHAPVAELSADLGYVTLSGGSRGGVWSVADGTAAFLSRGFDGAYVGPDGRLVVDLPAWRDDERKLGRLDLRHGGEPSYTELGDRRIRLRGPIYLEWQGAEGKENTIAAFDAFDDSELWSRRFESELPWSHTEPPYEAVVFEWTTASDEVRTRGKRDPALKARLAKVDRKRSSLLEVVDARTGEPRGTVLVDTGRGYYNVRTATATGDEVYVSGFDNRLLAYRLGRDEPRARLFGRKPLVGAGALALSDSEHALVVYDRATLAERKRFDLGTYVTVAGFAAGGERLLALTADQRLHDLDPRP